MIFIIYYFLGIYLTILNYKFVKKDNFVITLGLHIVFTVPSSFFLSKEILEIENITNKLISVFLLTILLILISLMMSGIIIKKK